LLQNTSGKLADLKEQIQERIYRTIRENILDAYLFKDIRQVQHLADEWMEDFNYNRPHGAFRGKTPDYYRQLKRGDIGNSTEFPISPHFQQHNIFLN
jgi:putative transposase